MAPGACHQHENDGYAGVEGGRPDCPSVRPLLDGLPGPSLAESAQTAPLAVLLWAFLDVIVLSYPIVRSRWTGWRLAMTIFFVFYGVTTFLSQIRTVVLLQYMEDIVPVEETPRLFLNGAIAARIFSPFAVLVHGRMTAT